MIDKLSNQQRMVLAVVLAIVFFIAYDYFYVSKHRVDFEQNASQQSEMIDKNLQSSASQNIQNTNTPLSIKTPEHALVSIESPEFKASIDDFARISSFILEDERYRNEDGKQIELINSSNNPYPLEMRFTNPTYNKLAFEIPYTANKNFIKLENEPQELILTQDLGELKIEKKLTLYPNGRYDLEVTLNKDAEYFITPGVRPSATIDNYATHGAIVVKNDGKLEIVADGKVKKSKADLSSSIVAAGIDRYYTTLFFNENKDLNVIMSENSQSDALIFLRNSQPTFKTTAYIGPKNHETLNSINPQLNSIIEYGWITFLAKPLFKFLSAIHGFIGNWGWSIVLMTIFIRILLYPLTYRGMISMNKLKDLAPKVKELQEKYKGDSQKLNQHMMALYKKHGANPMGGCLPILLQIPVFFAMYRVLFNAIELKGAPWILWIHDLAIKDPYFILPILMGITMFLQQKLTPTTFTDPMQEKIMKFLPLIFVFFFFMFPAGLTLYWFTNNLCSIVQQLLINRIFAKKKQEKISEHKHENRS